MNKLVKYFLLTGLALNFLVLPAIVLADEPAAPAASADTSISGLLDEAAGSGGAGYNTSEEMRQTGIATIVGTVARAFISLIGIIFVSYTIYGGFLWMTARGNDEQISKAKNTIRDGVIGIIVVLASAAIYITVRELLLTGTVVGTG